LEKHAGWDFFVPNDLTLGDFFNNSAAFINEFVEVYTEDLPVRFLVNHNGEIRRYGFYAINNTSIGIKYYKYNGNVFKVDEISELLTLKVEEILLLPGSKILIPSGIHVNLPTNVFLNAENKSGIASKRGLVRGACLIDNDYQGQIHINLLNPTCYNVKIKPGEKIVQFVPYFKPMMNTVIEYTSKEELYKNTESIRGEGGFGSSGI
jgi:dUTP pyrophosphatase